MGKLNVHKKKFFIFLWLYASLSLAVGKELVKESYKNPLEKFVHDKKWTLVLQEADEIQREIVWLITESRPLFNKTLFGKLLRAKLQAQGIKLKDKSKHSCDIYQTKDMKSYFQVSEFCQKYRLPDILAEVDASSQTELKVKFYGQNFSDVIGVSAALVAPKVECLVVVDADLRLVKLSCENFKFSRKDQIVELKKMEYDKNRSPTISLEGVVLENMLPYSKLSVVVPEVGKIKIKEVKLRPDPNEYDPKVNAKKNPLLKATPPSLQTSPSVEKMDASPLSVGEEPVQKKMEIESEKYIFTPEGEKVLRQTEPEFIEMTDETRPSQPTEQSRPPLRSNQPYKR
ncbi:MAG: hypothetical protein HUU56_06380 [Bdellovibrionaceae bacterium]|nr:hypothetical protein [Pseudobdellovibrionaceae bacterium]